MNRFLKELQSRASISPMPDSPQSRLLVVAQWMGERFARREQLGEEEAASKGIVGKVMAALAQQRIDDGDEAATEAVDAFLGRNKK